MEKFNTIDDFINFIIMKFGDDKIIAKEVKKLANLDETKKFIIENNKVKFEIERSKGEKFFQTIEVSSNKITVIEEGIKQEKNIKKEFNHIFTYSIEGTRKTVFNSDEDREITLNDDGTVLDKFITKDYYKYYDNDIFLGSSLIENEKTGLLDYDNFVIEENKNNREKMIYALPTQDKVKYEEINGEVTYSFYSKSDNYDENFYKEITKEDFDRLIEKSDDIFKIVNDDIFYESRKMHY